LRLRIHRGAEQVGGNCIELEAQGTRLVLDIGQPLDADSAADVPLPPIDGLTAGSGDGPLGVLLSHTHMDHCGLIGKLRSDLPLFMGLDSQRLLAIGSFFTRQATPTGPVVNYEHRHSFQLGPYRITPYLNDHSAFDAYSFHIEAGGRALFYSGDFRAHGRKSSLFTALTADPPQPVHTLLMEGTSIGRSGANETYATEDDVEHDLVSSIRGTAGLVLVWFSPQNIDRFVTFYRAAIRAQRIFVGDLYLANVIDALNRRSLPNARSKSIRVFLPRRQRLLLRRTRRFDLEAPYHGARIYPEAIGATPERFVMLFRSSMIEDVEALPNRGSARLIYSLWPGYLKKDCTDMKGWCEKRGIAFEIAHTSGHADLGTLRRLVAALHPQRVVPIHTSAPERYDGLFPNVARAPDGAWVEV
jgi:ribonuclease J